MVGLSSSYTAGVPIDSPDPAALRQELLAELPAEARVAIGRIAESAPDALYAAGGAVRDLLLGRRVTDIDLVVEADAIETVGRALPDARVASHARFRTARVTAGGVRIDVATARTETYAHPGALPKVAPADIEADLARRDFSVNAMALRLSGKPALLDPCGGRDDVAGRLIRVLHDRSFIDDPTRILRAYRYAGRLGFSLEPETARLACEAAAHLAAVGGARLRREIELTFAEPDGAAALEAMQAAGVLDAIHPALRWSAAAGAGLRGHRGTAHAPLGFALLAARASVAECVSLAARLSLKRDEAAAVAAMPRLREAALTLRRPGARPSGVAVVLDRFPAAAVEAFAAIGDDAIARALAARYLESWRSKKPLLTGADLQAMGVPLGPQIARGLQLLRAAKLDGLADSRDDERALAARFAKSIRDARAATSSVDLKLNGN